MSTHNIKIHGKTHTGEKRKMNQDNLVYIEEEKSPLPGYTLLAVADGMGGHAGGEVASELALDSFVNEIRELSKMVDDPTKLDVQNTIKKAFSKTNNDVRKKGAENIELHGMGTTLTIALMNQNQVIFGNLGDSRGYIIRGKDVLQITDDHSFVGEQVKAGLITPEEAEIHPHRNIITKAIGIDDSTDTDVFTENLIDGDIVLLCSDGLYPLISNEEIIEHIHSPNLSKICDTFIDIANSRGGPDNITVALARFGKQFKSKDLKTKTSSRSDKNAITQKEVSRKRFGSKVFGWVKIFKRNK